MKKKVRKTVLKEAVVLLITAAMILSVATVTANTDKALKIPNNKKNINLISRDEFLNESWDDGIPGDWTQELVNLNYYWDKYYGGWFWDPPGEKHPEEPHTEPWNVMFEPTTGPEGAITKLITPSMDISGAVEPKLTFWYAIAEDETVQPAHTGQEIITVYYKTSAAGAWIEVPGGHYEDDTPEWTETTLGLPDPSADYYIAFEGEYHWGFGACIDDVVVFEHIPPLVADADGPYEAFEDEPIQFQGSAEGGVPPYSFHWDFGNGDMSDIQNPMYTYTNAGNYTVTLTVTDDESNTASDTTWALINGPPNAPTIDGPGRGSAGTSYEYTFTSTDPDEDQVSYYIKWGDGDVTDWTPLQASGLPGYSESHTWDIQDEYTITAKAKDENGLEGPEATLTVTMPRNRAINRPFLNFLQQHPNLFPILQLLMQRLGLQ